MSRVVSSKVAMNRPQKAGALVRYAIVIEDDIGAQETLYTAPKHVPAGFDVAADATAQSAAILQKLTDAEISEYKQDIESGANPFQAKTPRFNTRASLLQAILSEALTLPANEPIVMNGTAMLALVTDAELNGLFGFSQAEVDNIRAQAATLQTAIDALNAYQPVLGGA